MRGAGPGSVPRAAARTRPALRETLRWSALAGAPVAMTVMLSADIAQRADAPLLSALPMIATLSAGAFSITQRPHVDARRLAGFTPIVLAATLGAMLAAPGLVIYGALLTLTLFSAICAARLCDLAPRPSHRARFAASVLTGAAISGGVCVVIARDADAAFSGFAVLAIASLLLLPASTRLRTALLRAPAWTLGILIVLAAVLGVSFAGWSEPRMAALIGAGVLGTIACVKARTPGLAAFALCGVFALILWSA